jgi:hypothetical protein
LQYHRFDPPDYNTFDPGVADHLRAGGIRFLGNIDVDVLPLSEALSTHLPNTKIDLMSVDCEGLDLDVLKSNDWDRFRPSLLLVEDHVGDFANALESPVTSFLYDVKYVLVARLNYTSVFVAREEVAQLNAGWTTNATSGPGTPTGTAV